jgi:ELWxxDGT repeat protein
MRAALLLVVAVPLPAQELIRDIRPSQQLSATSNPQQLCAAGGWVWFTANDLVHGSELWRTDGTAAGTQMFVDFAPGAASSDPGLLTAFAGGLAFANSSGLCWTDGTPGNVVLLGPAPSGDVNGYRVAPFVVGSRLFFVAASGGALWASDGTPGGTSAILPGGFMPNSFCGLGGVLYFAARSAPFTTRLFRSDGTAAGTFEVAPAAGYGSCDEVAVAGGRVFFSTLAHELWQSDGTAAGTTLVRGGFTVGPSQLTGVASSLVFVAGDATTGGEAWTSDGTAAGTQMLADTCPGPTGGVFGNFTVLGARVLFNADDGVHGVEPWTSDLTPAGTGLLGDLNPGPGWSPMLSPRAIGNGVFFAADNGAGYELWFTDGTPAGTHLVRDINPTGESDPGAFAPLGALTVFTADDGVHGREPWITDGTAAGTRLLRDIASVPLGSDPSTFGAIGKHTVFTANDGVHGSELWGTDGTTAGTMLLVDTVPGASQGSYALLGRWRGRLWFVVRGTELWSTDGTPAGTALQFDLAPAMASAGMNVILWLVGLDDRAILGGESHLLVTDGTAVGTTALPFTSQQSMTWGVRFGDYAYFPAAGDAAHGFELWRSDGTAAGTTLFFDFNPGPGNSFIQAVPVGDRLYLSAASQVSPTFPFGPLDVEPWVTDGTVAGTVRLGDLAPGSASSSPNSFVAFAGSVWFAAGGGIYRTDGTPAGTVLAVNTSSEGDLVAAGQRLFFLHAGEVWSTDGTPGGTAITRDIAPGAAGSDPRDFVALGASTELAFTAVQPGQPRTLWLTDGTTAGTRQVPSLVLDGFTRPIARNGTDLFLAADDGTIGRELYALRLRSEFASMADLLGDGCRGTTGVPRMRADVGPRLGSAFAIDLDRALPNAPVFAAHAFALVPGGDRAGCAPALDLATGVSLFLMTDGNGHARTSVFVPNAPFALGLEIYSQWVVVDPAGGFLGALALSPVLDWLVGV